MAILAIDLEKKRFYILPSKNTIPNETDFCSALWRVGFVSTIFFNNENDDIKIPEDALLNPSEEQLMTIIGREYINRIKIERENKRKEEKEKMEEIIKQKQLEQRKDPTKEELQEIFDIITGPMYDSSLKDHLDLFKDSENKNKSR